MNKIISFGFIICTCICFTTAYREVFKWKQIEYDQLPAQTGSIVTDYVAYNNVPFGVSRYGNRFFVTVPRRRTGIPSTLNFVEANPKLSYDQSPKLKAYPDFLTNTPENSLIPNPDRIISVYRSRIDCCGRLWFIDSGLLEFPNNRTQVQPPSLWIIDLSTNQRIRRYEFPRAIQTSPEGFMGLTIDVEPNDCDNAFAYMPNMRTFSINVYSFKQDKAWSTRHNYFYVDPLSGDLNIAGYSFQWADGVFSVALGPKLDDGYRWAYFHAMTSLSEFRVSTRILRAEQLATRSYHGEDLEYVGSRGPKLQANLHDIDVTTGIMYYPQIQTNAIACWDTNTPYKTSNHHIVYQDNATLIYPSDMKLDHDGNLLAIANKIPIFAFGTLDVTDFNFRIWLFKTPRSCDTPRRFGGH